MNMSIEACAWLLIVGFRGLAALSEAVLGFEMDKDLNVRVGNWEAEPLSERQVRKHPFEI